MEDKNTPNNCKSVILEDMEGKVQNLSPFYTCHFHIYFLLSPSTSSKVIINQ
nr:MAG TPA: hypothetical protein [Caudoviricetes sp.]